MKRFLLMLVITAFTAATVTAQRVTTLLINPSSSVGDALTVDWRGNVYASDFQGGTAIYKIKPNGEATTYATGFNGPAGSDFDSHGNLFVANFNSGVVSKVTPDGAVSTFAAGLNGPVGVVVDEHDNVFVTDAGIGNNPGRKISKITPDGIVSTFVDFGAIDPGFLALGGLARDRRGNFYVSNFINGKIKKVTPNGTATDFAIIPGNISFETGPLGYLTYSNGNLFVTYIGGNQIFKITLAGETSVFAGTGQPGEVDGSLSTAQFNGPNGIAATRFGAVLYVSDVNARSLRRITGVRRAGEHQ